MQTPSQPTADTARAIMRERDTIHRRAVTVLAHAIRAMRNAGKPADGRSLAERLMDPDQVSAMTEIVALSRDGAEFASKAVPLSAALLGAPPEMLKSTTPTDRTSYIMGWNAALTFMVTSLARPWVTVSLEQEPPKADDSAKTQRRGDRLARLLEELKGATGADIGVEVVEVDLGGGHSFRDGDLAKEMLDGIRSLLGGDGSAPTCAEPDQLLNVIRVRDRGPNAAPAPEWTDVDGAPWELKPGDFIEEQTLEGTPEGEVTVDGQTWQRYASTDQRSLVREADGSTVVVTGSVSYEQLAEFAGRLST